MHKNYIVPKNLLSKGLTNAKTAKNSLKTYILYLAPYTQNSKGHNLCPNAGNCKFVCLYTAGRGKFSNVQNARINKANYFVEDKERFLLQLAGELIKINERAKFKGELIAIRLNGTSDIDFIYLLEKYAKLQVLDLAQLIFYDYTKVLARVKRYVNEPRYTLTFSRAEDNHNEALEALGLGANVSAVFGGELPFNYLGAPVVDGDKSDIVMLYNKGAVLGLRAKGDAKKDKTGFVVHVNA